MPTLTMIQPEPLPVMLEWALHYASLGWHVFPLHTPANNRCDCNRGDCRQSGKHPRTRNGLTDASNSPDQISRWWSMWPHANIGVSCGPSGLAVLDVDPGHGGDESFRDLAEAHPDISWETVRSITGSGGTHYLFAAPDGREIRNSAGALGPGIDVRGVGGYIVVPPSLHATGNEYAWESAPHEGEILPWPDGLEPQRKRSGESSILPEAFPDGQRENNLISLAGTLRRRGMTALEIYEMIRIANHRCDPPLPDSDLRRIAHSVARYEPGKDIPATLIRGGTSSVTNYERLRVIATDPPSYLLTINGEDVRLTDPEIGRHEAVRAAARRQLFRMPPRMTAKEWDEQLDSLLRAVEILPAPDDASLDGLIWSVISAYFRQYVSDDGENFPARPVRQEDTIIASGPLIRNILTSHGIKATQPEIWNVVRRHGGVSQSVRFGAKVHKAWVLPKPEEVE